VLTNSDGMQHNFVLGLPGSLDTIGAAADELARSPNGVTLQYVPEIGQILFSTKLVEPGETLRVRFRVPSQPGRYPYVCTFPGHWRIMNGILTVVASTQVGSR
jgi:azurin